jgi:fructose-1,6-bisphosphatase/inositol monophosphatase family enzyme
MHDNPHVLVDPACPQAAELACMVELVKAIGEGINSARFAEEWAKDALVEHIRPRWPGDRVLAPGDWISLRGRAWTVRAIDCRDHYFADFPTWGSAVALLIDGRAACSVIYFRERDRLYVAGPGQALCNGERIRAAVGGGGVVFADGPVLALGCAVADGRLDAVRYQGTDRAALAALAPLLRETGMLLADRSGFELQHDRPPVGAVIARDAPTLNASLHA